jgi:hypothetical protein
MLFLTKQVCQDWEFSCVCIGPATAWPFSAYLHHLAGSDLPAISTGTIYDVDQAK